MYIISGEFQVKEKCKRDLIKMSLDLIPLSQKEEGCISYSFLENHGKKNHFLFFERWKSKKDITEHFEKEYFKKFAERFPGMIEGSPIIEIHEVANTEQV